tara:strand:- start:607 stop:2019 length:1413 start_codon:yes stop_codon:yes gene_type:complete
MTVNFDTAKTGIFARLGKIFGVMDRTATFQGDIVDNSTKSFQEAINEYVNTLGATDNTNLEMATLLLTNLDQLRNNIGTPIFSRLSLAAKTTLIEMMHADTPLPQKDVRSALMELRNQMDAASETVDGTTITIGSATTSGTGNGTVVLNVTPDKRHHAKITQYPTARSETLVFRCVRDASSKNVVKGGEVFVMEGEQPFEATDHRWPGGSGVRTGLVCTSDNLNDGRAEMRNILRNSNFEAFTSNTPKAWRVATGSAGTHVYEESSTVARGTKCLKMASNGSTLIRVDQQMNSIAGSPAKPSVDLLMCISLLARKSGTSSSAGSLRVGFAQEDGTIVSGSTFNTAHGSISDSAWTHLTHSFRLGGTALSLPDPMYFMVQQSTAFTNGTNLFIDGLVCSLMYKTAAGGVACSIVPGTTDFKVGDTVTVQVTNNGEGEIEKYMDRFFNLYNQGVFFPQNLAGSETIADSLVS